MPAIETAGAFNAETTSPARSPVRNRHRESRKTPGFQRLHRRTPGHPDWLAEGAVSSEPVSNVQIPCSTGKYREFRDFERSNIVQALKNARDSAHLHGQFPKRANREFFTRIREEI